MEISTNHYSFSTSNQTRPRQEAMDRVKTPSRVIERRSWILLRLTGGFHLMPQDADSMTQRCAAPVRACALITLSTAPASLHFRAPSPFWCRGCLVGTIEGGGAGAISIARKRARRRPLPNSCYSHRDKFPPHLTIPTIHLLQLVGLAAAWNQSSSVRSSLRSLPCLFKTLHTWAPALCCAFPSSVGHLICYVSCLVFNNMIGVLYLIFLWFYDISRFGNMLLEKK